MNLDEFSKKNAQRSTAANGFNQNPGAWSISDWLVATMGELGEAANVLKKLNRYRDGVNGNIEDKKVLLQQFEQEIADTFIYLDLLSQASGFLLSDAVRKTWNEKSEKIGFPGRI